MQRPIVSVFIALSLDGFIARPDGSLDWLERVQEGGGEDFCYARFFESVDALVLGRNTYDTVLGFPSWPFDGKTVAVLSHRPLEPVHGELRHLGALEPLLDALFHQGVRRVYLDGGAAIRQGLREGVVDDLTLSWIPVVLGSGRRLFGDDLPELPLRLRESRAFPAGLVQSVYTRV